MLKYQRVSYRRREPVRLIGVDVFVIFFIIRFDNNTQFSESRDNRRSRNPDLHIFAHYPLDY